MLNTWTSVSVTCISGSIWASARPSIRLVDQFGAGGIFGSRSTRHRTRAPQPSIPLTMNYLILRRMIFFRPISLIIYNHQSNNCNLFSPKLGVSKAFQHQLYNLSKWWNISWSCLENWWKWSGKLRGNCQSDYNLHTFQWSVLCHKHQSKCWWKRNWNQNMVSWLCFQ